jgi:hypothetical protein
MTARITTKEFAVYRICPDVKQWFERHGLDWERFILEGMTADELRGPGDRLKLIDKLEALAIAREAK